MGRKRIGTVRETYETLQVVLNSVRESAYEPRLRLLLALKEQPDAKSEVLMGIVGHSERTIRRWWKAYRDGGLAELTDHWPGSILAQEPRHDYPSERRSQLIGLLNAIPETDDLTNWETEMNEALTAYSGAGCDVVVHLPPASQMLDRVADDRHVVLPIRRAEEHQVGEVVLSVEDGHSIPEEALRRINDLLPFLHYLITDAQTRSAARNSHEPKLGDFILSNPLITCLSNREREVLLLRIQGSTYSETARTLNISEETVRKHVKTIYQKTGTSSISELFNRCFASLVTSAVEDCR